MKEYYVANDGDDSNDGLSPSTPWRTIGHVNTKFGNTIFAGDNVYFKRGDTFNDAQLTVGVSGESEANPTVIGAYGDSELPIPFFNDPPSGSCIEITSKEYVTIENIKLTNYGYNWIEVLYGSYITIQNCIAYGCDATPAIEIGFTTSGECDHIYIRNNIFENAGKPDPSGTDVVRIAQTTYCLFENNIVIGGPLNNHACLMVRTNCYNIIVRGNTFYDGDDDNVDCAAYSENCLYENNIIYGTNGAGMKHQCGYRNIIRNNVVYGCDSYGLGGYTNERTKSIGISYCKWYHNTVYDCGDYSSGGSPMDACYRVVIYRDTLVGHDWAHNIVKNNILYKGDRQVIYVDAVPGYDSWLHDNIWDNNIIFESVSAKPILYKGIFYTANEAESALPNTFRNNIEANPLLVNPANGDFRLQEGSPAILAAASLTETNGAGNGTQITLDDAGYFCDGFGLINGDQITIGSNPPVMITNVNYDTNIITVDQPVSWNNGDPVFLSGCYDIGAVQSGAEPDCINPDGQDGDIICGDPNYGQNPLNHYQCQCVDDVCNWVDLGYSSDCDVPPPPPPPPSIPIWVWPLLFGGFVLGAIIVKVGEK